MTSHVLHLGDCLDPVTGLASLPDKSVDHVITDPPFSAHVCANSVRGKGHKPGGERRALGFDAMTSETAHRLATEIARTVRRWSIICSDLESIHLWRAALEEAGLQYVRTGLWVKKWPTPQMSGDRPAIGAEAILIAHPRGRKRWNGHGKAGVWTFPTAYRCRDQMIHTTQKPLALMAALVQDFTDPGETILDPFSGSGTTLVAAKQLGRGAIGWEMDPKYHAAALARLEAPEQGRAA